MFTSFPDVFFSFLSFPLKNQVVFIFLLPLVPGVELWRSCHTPPCGTTTASFRALSPTGPVQGEDRHGPPQHELARPGAVPHPEGAPPPHGCGPGPPPAKKVWLEPGPPRKNSHCADTLLSVAREGGGARGPSPLEKKMVKKFL